MIGFHIDMNIAQFRGEYLQRWLHRLAEIGYDSVLWEVENNIRWQTCPQCCSPDAFSKAQFRVLLDECRRLKLESIPLLQTIGHCEYVLKHPEYRAMAEQQDDWRQYCPLKSQVAAFLKRWIEEYLELFSDVQRFHIGADEAWILGSCPDCRAYVQQHSLSELYINYINQIIEPITARGLTPALWCDMVLSHPEALSRLSRQVMIFDWMYNIYRGNGRFWIWGEGMRDVDSLSETARARFGKYLFPQGEEPGILPETFYSADYLADQGFNVVTCPSSSSYGDNVFAPRTLLHMRNSFDSMRKGLSDHLAGTLLTSWTVHLFPWELQWPCIDMPRYLLEHRGGDLEDYRRWFVARHFQREDDGAFWQACGQLSNRCLFSTTAELGFDKSASPVARDHVARRISTLKQEGKLEQELANCRVRLPQYQAAEAKFAEMSETWADAEGMLGYWRLAAGNMVHRAKAGIHLAGKALGGGGDAGERRALLEQLQTLRGQSDAMYEPMIKPTRRSEILGWLYDSMEEALRTV